MALTNYPNVEQRSDEWYNQRRGLVTASVVGNLISIGKQTAADFDCPECGALVASKCIGKRGGEIQQMHTERAEYARKNGRLLIEPASNAESCSTTEELVAERISGYTETKPVSGAMWRGIEDEPLARAFYAENYAPVTEVGFMVEDRWGFRIGYSPDGLVGEDGLIEVKSRNQRLHLRTVLDSVVPIEHMAQLQCGLLVSGRQWIDYISWCGGMKFWVKRVYPQRDWFTAIVKAVSKFEAAAMEKARQYDEATEHLPLTERRVRTTTTNDDLIAALEAALAEGA